MDIIAFLEARIAEDEAVALAASPAPWEWFGEPGSDTAALYSANERTVLDARADHAPGYLECKAEDRVYIARFNPGRILAEGAAKRQMLANVPLVTDIPSEVGGTSEFVLMCMASPYRDHRDYQDGWAIEL
ncbi:hypothetical protein B1A87_021620 [Arthrobacter sp. KBS0703]|uniref:DUF6221 family protein n=1 Tax=Arthrobacter sp. KBS0703 TaxID=1955698 RepID=UPI00098EF6E7|nr:DUF6221 family protein [Arthrobacter sp. KBS0703]TSE14448.1 hypothetical protein B1A87_021620 [Arthrobacter sp. KBS0703]